MVTAARDDPQPPPSMIRSKIQRIEPYMQHCVRVTLTNPGALPDTVLLLPASYGSTLAPIGREVDVDTTAGGEDCLVRLNTVVVMERSCGEEEGDSHWEHCLSAGGNLSTVVMDRRLPVDATCALTICPSS